jgi:hypothetical protein
LDIQITGVGIESPGSASFYAGAFEFTHIEIAAGGLNPGFETSKEKRHNISTLAATLLLGFYEVMTADHSSWCRHLSGASRLLQEINFFDMAAHARAAQQEQAALDNQTGNPNLSPTSQQERSHPSVLDDDLVSKIINRKFGIGPPKILRKEEFDLDRFQLLQDLFWWYARQDTYQSFIAGNRLW